MILDLRSLEELPARIELEAEAERLKLNIPGGTVFGIVRVRLDIISGDNFYYCQGRAVCDVTMECSRCLGAYTDHLEGEVDFTVLKTGKGGRGLEESDLPENLVTAMVSGWEIEIDGPLSEALSLEVDLRPLCAQGCLGLCPQCGIDRNRTKCECKQETIDPRWDDLRKLDNSDQAR